MKKLFPILVSLCAALAVQAAPGDTVTRSASGTTNAQIIFPADATPMSVLSFNVTADNATNRLYFYPASTPRPVLIPNTATTNLTVTLAANTFTTNDVLIFQNSAGLVTNKTVTIRANTTNKLVQLTGALATNLAIGDVFYERQATAYTPGHVHAANATTIYLNTTNGLNVDDLLLLDRGSGNKPLTAVIATVAATPRFSVNLNRTLAADVAAGATVHKQLYGTNVTLRLNRDAGETVIMVSATNGMVAATNLLIETTLGRRQIAAIDSISATNVTLADALDFAVTTNDRVRILGYNTTTVLAQPAGSAALTLTAHTGFAANDTVILATTPPARTQFAGAFTTNNLPTVTLDAAFGAVALPGNRIYELTNTYTVKRAAEIGARAVVTDTATGLAAGDVIAIVKANNDVSLNRIAPVTADDISTTLTFATPIGITLGLNDRVWLEGAPANTLIGAATVSREGTIYSQSTAGPLRVWLSGATACSINSLTVRYRY
jgi:hypothetical protein